MQQSIPFAFKLTFKYNEQKKNKNYDYSLATIYGFFLVFFFNDYVGADAINKWFVYDLPSTKNRDQKLVKKSTATTAKIVDSISIGNIAKDAAQNIL